MGIGMARHLNIVESKYSFCAVTRILHAAKIGDGIAGNQTNCYGQIRIGLDHFAANNIGCRNLRFPVTLNFGNVVPTVAIDVTEVHAAAGERRDIWDGEPLLTQREFEKKKRIDDPAHFVGRRVVIDCEFV